MIKHVREVKRHLSVRLNNAAEPHLFSIFSPCWCKMEPVREKKKEIGYDDS